MSGTFRPRVPSAVRKHARKDLAKKARSSTNAAGESLREQQVWQPVNINLCNCVNNLLCAEVL